MCVAHDPSISVNCIKWQMFQFGGNLGPFSYTQNFHTLKETDTHTKRERKNHRSKKKKGNKYTHIERERKNHRLEKKKGNRYTHIERERKNHRSEKKKGNIHTHWEWKKRYEIFIFPLFGFWVLKRRVLGCLEEKGFGFGREAVCSTTKRRKKKKNSFNAVCLRC